MTSALPNPQSQPLTRGAPSAAGSDTESLSIESLHALYAPRIFRFLLASTRDRDLAETLTQETFLRAFVALKPGSDSDAQFRGDSSPATWLTRIALNLLRDHTRTNRFRFWKQALRTSVAAEIDAPDLAAHLPSSSRSAEAALIAHQQLALVWRTVGLLSDRQRTVFLLRFVEELELHDIASVTGLPLPTVKTHLYRALATIRAEHLHTPAAPAKDSPK